MSLSIYLDLYFSLINKLLLFYNTLLSGFLIICLNTIYNFQKENKAIDCGMVRQDTHNCYD